MRRDRGLLFFALVWLGLSSLAPAATFTVTNTANSGAGSLRQAVIDANASPGADTINVNVTGTVTLSTSLPALTGDIDLNGPAAGSFTVTGGASVAIFAGPAAVGKSSAGTVVLSAASSNTGGTRVSGGVLQGSTTSLQGDIANNANVTLSQTTTGTYAGNMSGTGSLTKAGTGTVTLSGTNTYSGGTTISAGTLQGDTTSLQGNIVDNATVNFNQTTAGTYAGDISGSGAIFKQGAGTLTLTGTNTNTGTTTVSAGTLQGNTANLRNNITNNAAITFDQGSAGTYSGVMSGTGSLTKQGAGTLTLTGANTYSGGTTVSAGTLQGSVTAVRGNITNNAAVVFDQPTNATYSGVMSGSGSLTKQGAGTLTLSGANTYSGGTTVSAGALQGSTTNLQGNIANDASVIFNQGSAGTYSGVMSGAGSLTKSGAGTLTLSGANTYSGGTTISAGTLQGDTTSLQGNIVDNATVNFNQATAGTYTGNISGTGAIIKQGAGTLTLTGTNTNTGTTTVSAGTLQGSTANLRNNITNNAAVVFDQGSAGTYSGAMSGTGSLTKQGAGTLTLTGANTYSGGTTVSAGVLQGDAASVQGNIANNSNVTFNQAAAGTYAGVMSGSGSLTKQGAGTLTLSGANTYSGGTSVSAGVLQGTTTSLQGNIANNANVTISQTTAGTYAGAISGTGSLTKAGAGTVTLSGANTYSGGTTISAGTLQGDTTSLQGNIVDNATVNFNQTTGGTYTGNISGTGAIVKQGAGALTLTGTNTNTGTTTVSAGTLQGNTANLRNNITNNAAVVFDQGSAGTYSGVMSGTGSLTKQGAGTLTLTGANTYSGGTTVSAGTLQGTATAVRGNIANDATVVFDQTAAGTYSGAMTGSGTLVKQGAGTLTLSGANTYSGGTTASAGVLQGTTTSLQGNVTNNANVTISQTTAGTYAGAISGTGSLTKAGTGTVTLSGANTYSGGTTISAGTLQGDTTSLQGNIVDNATVTFNQTSAGTYTGNISGTGAIVKQGAGTLTLTGTNTNTGTTTVSAGTLQGNTANLRNNITNNAAVVFDQGSAGTYSGVMSGTGSLTKQGAGTLTLSGANTYTGGTTVSAGTLQGSTTNLQGNIANNANVTFNQAAAGTYSGVMSGSGSLTKQGAGTLTLSGTNTYSGGTTISAGALQGTTTSLQGNITNNANVTISQTTAGTYAGAISGTGSLTKAGTGTVTLSGGNTYSGGTTISAGTLQGDTTSLQGNIVDNATVNFNQTTAGTYTGNISGTGAIVKQGAGALTLTGTNTNTGTTTVSAGTLQGNTANLRNNITNNAAVVFDQGSAGTYSGVMSGTGSLAKQGAGTLTLTGANTYSGGTTVSAGTLQGTATAVRGNITNNAAVVFNQPTSATYSGVMTGSGSLTKQGAGTLTLSGANTYSGGTTVSAGALQGTTTSLQGNIANNANVTFNQTTTGTHSGNISGTGSLTKSGSGTVTLGGTNSYSGGTTISAGVLQGNSASLQGNIVDNATLRFDQTTDGTYAGNISGTGQLSKQGAGRLNLTGNVSVAGQTTVSAGNLAVNGALSGPVQVQSGGTLSGHGSVGAVVNQGTVAPGNSIGTLTVNGNYQQASNGTYQVEVNSAGQSDLLAVSGTAALDGAVDVVAQPGSYVAGTSYTILTAGGGVSGQFSVLNYNFLNMQPMLVYESNLVRIVLVRPPTHFAAIADTFNQHSVGAELDALNPLATGQMAFTIDQLAALSPNGQRIGLDQLSGELHATAETVALDNTGYLLQLVSDRIRLGPLPEDGCGDGRSESRWRTWFLGAGQGGLLHSDGNAGLVNYTFAATTLGVETTLDEGLRAGVWLAYGPAAANRNGDRLDLDTGYAGLYGVRQIGPSYLMGTVSYWHGDFSTRRHIAFGDVAEAPRANYGGDGLAAYLEQGYAFDFGDWSVRPLIGLQYMNLTQSGYHEHGAGELDLIGPGRSLDSLRSVCGARLVRSLGPASACTLLELRARWTHEFFDQAPGITQLFDAPGATPFNIRGLTPSQDALLLGAGLRVPVSQRADVFFGYDANLATRQTAHGGNVGFQVVW